MFDPYKALHDKYRNDTGQAIMAGTDWCKAYKKNNPGNCATSGCPHEEHCKGFTEIVGAVSMEIIGLDKAMAANLKLPPNKEGWLRKLINWIW